MQGESMPTVDEILEELRNHRRDLKTLFASHHDMRESDAARTHESAARRHDESAASHRLAAQKARDDEDDEDAAGHEAAAKSARLEATRARTAARIAYEASAKALAANDEAAAKLNEAEAKRMQDEEEAAAKRYADDDEDMRRHEEKAAAKSKGMSSNIAPMFAMLVRALTNDGDNMDALKDVGNLTLLRAMMTAMTYPAGGPMLTGKRSNADAVHDDTAEDTALFRRLMKQYKEGDALNASRSVTDLRLERKLRSLEAAMGEMNTLLTDVVHSMHNLATDTVSKDRALSTDTNRQHQGGPVRRTMSAMGGEWRGKFDDQNDEQTMADIDATLDEQRLDPVARMAAKLELLHAGKVKI